MKIYLCRVCVTVGNLNKDQFPLNEEKKNKKQEQVVTILRFHRSTTKWGKKF